ncbi:DUF6909 family protein [Capillimicrobium parvum]|uniref:Uncharacterized protein n=1 Tax=Capillimicrobium parvum TaxID=2884022 RepID=A0A9E7C6S9_9ACTN|nr:hypothetical protein [Capillimicrobium parvum]UGS38967.1 hypothetical protein DSM104329_05399 [Capillimicrobium parvum]
MPAPRQRRSLRELAERVSDEVELYHRTYSTLLRSSGETLLRVLEPSHRAMESSLHAGAASDDPDLGAFLYATHRLPSDVWRARLVAMGQDAIAFQRAGLGDLDAMEAVEAPARRRRWHRDGSGLLGVLIASGSDLDDLIPTLVAYQIEWNKLHDRVAGLELPEAVDAAWCAELLGGGADDWARIAEAWDGDLRTFLGEVGTRELDLRIRMLSGSEVGYGRVTRRWWSPILACLHERGLLERRLYLVSSNTHSLVNLLTGAARAHEDEIVDWLEHDGPADLRAELGKLRSGRTRGSWDNLLYFTAREFFGAYPESAPTWDERRTRERRLGVAHIPSSTAVRVSAQVFDPRLLDPEALDPRLADVDAGRLATADAVIVNIDYPLGVGAYNILREIGESTDTLAGVYVLGKAATLNADVGDVLISDVVHDEHSRSTYWLDNAFSFDDIAPFLLFGSGLDNQRAVTVKSTFLQNREYLDFYYREAFTVVEMEAGPFCNAVYEIADLDRYPVGEAVNFAKLPIDFGVIHYASDTPYTQARTLGARGLSYYGMDSTYAASLAILRRIMSLEGLLRGAGGG